LEISKNGSSGFNPKIENAVCIRYGGFPIMVVQNKRPRLLLVCYANSAHALSWISLLDESGFDVRVFSTALREEEKNTRDWHHPTYMTIKPEKSIYRTARVFSLLPGRPIRGLSSLLDERYSITARWLRWVIRTWKPDILHSMPLDVGGKLAAQALETLPRSIWPKWVVSSWGSDIYLGLDDPQKSKSIQYILANCDGFMADCKRDLELAVQHGLDPQKLASGHALPGAGGLDLEEFAQLRVKHKRRDVILLPKAFEREHANRTLPALEALHMLNAELQSYEIHLASASQAVRAWLRQMPKTFQDRCHIHSFLPQGDLFELYARARIVLAPSLSDGTPNVMLEAMAAGALPIMSPIESIKEWITDGENGLLAHALYPDKVAAALQRALTDDALFEQAQRINWEIICQRVDRRLVCEEVLTYYKGLFASPKRPSILEEK
jgi:glycosyltransferase involved in cell wall biosynthesis